MFRAFSGPWNAIGEKYILILESSFLDKHKPVNYMNIIGSEEDNF